MKLKQTMLFIFIIILIFLRCDTTEPPPNKASLSLTLEDVSCTEAWVKLTTTNLPLPVSVALKQNEITRATINLSTADTLLYIDSLLPKQNYTYQVSGIGNPVSSNALTVTTLDTTFHNFTFQTWTFGEHSSSVLYDVAIINENNIWAVGEIYMKDTLGNIDHNAYNAVHWDGSEWKVKRITVLFRGSLITPPLEGVFAFSSTDIWFVGSLPIHGDGTNWTMYDLRTTVDPNLSLSRVWGTNSNNMYFAGRNGSIAHYSNGSWKKIESGTTVDLLDVWGSPDGRIVWACGYNGDYSISALIKIQNNISQTLFEGLSNSQSNEYYVGPMSGVWSDNDYRIFMMTWGGIYSIKNNNSFFLDKRIARISDVGFGLDGTASNNLFACGEGFVGHWNGYSYKEYPELFIQQRVFKNVKANINTVCAVGNDYNSPIYSNAVIVLGK